MILLNSKKLWDRCVLVTWFLYQIIFGLQFRFFLKNSKKWSQKFLGLRDLGEESTYKNVQLKKKSSLQFKVKGVIILTINSLCTETKILKLLFLSFFKKTNFSVIFDFGIASIPKNHKFLDYYLQQTFYEAKNEPHNLDP